MMALPGFGPAWELPDCRHFVVKAGCSLRMVALPYTLVPWQVMRSR
jgi:hypothetical protein